MSEPVQLVAIFRKAVLMEDEGREETIRRHVPQAEAEAWVAAQKDEYFKPHDYYLAKEMPRLSPGAIVEPKS